MSSQVETFANRVGAKFGFDPATITGIILAIMEIVQQCQNSRSQIVSSVRRPTLLQRMRATNIVMRNLNNVTRFQARRMADQIIDECCNASEEEILNVVDECCGGF